MKDEEAQFEVSREKGPDGKWKPVVYVLMPDGESEIFRDRCIIVKGSSRGRPPSGIRAVLIDDDGNFYHDEAGELIVLDVPPIPMELSPRPDRMITQGEAAYLAAVDRTTIWRETIKGNLTKYYPGGNENTPRLNEGEFREWMRQKMKGR